MMCRSDVNKKRYDTVTFLIGDKEFYALVLSNQVTGILWMI